MLPLLHLGTVISFILQYVSSTLKKFNAFSPCQVFTVLSDALGGCVTVFSFHFPQILLCCLLIIIDLAHGYVAEAFQNYYFYSPPSRKQMFIYILGNLSSADVTGRAILSLMETD